MVTDLVMPRYSLTMEKGTVVKWLKKEGEPVEKGEPIVEVEADKVTTQVDSPASGVLLKICEPEDAEVPVGRPIAFIGKPGEAIPKTEAPVDQESPRFRRTQATEVIKKKGAEKIKASPLARRIAREQGVDLTQILGSGAGGKITREDVLKFVETRKDSRAVKETLPMKSMQRTIAERMTKSIRTAAHCSVMVEADASRMKRLRQELNAKSESEGKPKVSHTAIIVKAVAMALKEQPIVNATLEDDLIKILEDTNIGVAVEVGEGEATGLLVPVVRKASEKSILEINQELNNMVERARSGKILHEDLTGGTFTITNLGMYGVEAFTPIINPPETAILGVGAIVDKPVVIEAEIQVRPLMNITMSFDHRVLNGAPAAKFLQRLKEILESEISAEGEL
ncbi:MAG: 2-oxo acid dehydrogenase subunit E2 [Candidatus Bathyarchaeota archaeon]|nr:2-oxo acid dehydrogenase subunit E2 [Candidatus Bathyarchaeota archaeon]